MKASIKKHFFRFNNGPDTLFQILVYYIDRVIDSMWKQIDLVVKQNGQKVKY